ncbi:MAG: nuclear transport factor 2 family protein [SAR86 cluster bacterium]|jgi:hypothetical protein|nr:nuclear transport factor 2 family protein [SAR86 cluster bacterium]|tara:strand:- start:320 stop:748 length:429 start_codon:yes stop_codon:yes gene_type:complete
MTKETNLTNLKEIERLSYLYASLIDKQEFNKLHLVFSDDAILKVPEYTFEGVDSIIACMEALKEYDKTQHFVMNQLVDLIDKNASNEVYTLAYHFSKNEGVFNRLDWGIIYRDKLIQNNEGWRICSRELELVWEKNSVVKYQ